MPVQFENYDFSYTMRGKPVFKPSELGMRIGADIKGQVQRAVRFDPFFYHLKKGGHVAALHSHRPHRLFARVDIERFFYGIGRNRVARALSEIGIARAGHYAKWSCVKNPYGDPRYALPYGFVQSPILATLVLMQSAAGTFLRELEADEGITVSVYMDDISLSTDNGELLNKRFTLLCDTLRESNFTINPDKIRDPGEMIDLFNCDLSLQRSQVRQDRKDKFDALPRTDESRDAFERYCENVERGNA